MTQINKTIEFGARISKSFNIFASNLTSKLYTKLLSSGSDHVALCLRLFLRLRLLRKRGTDFRDRKCLFHFNSVLFLQETP